MGTARALSISGDTITVGLPTVFASRSVVYIVTATLTENKALVAYFLMTIIQISEEYIRQQAIDEYTLKLIEEGII